MTEIIQSFDAFDALREEWNDLADHLERPLLRHEWFACCARAFYHDGDLRVVVVRHGGRLVAAAPFVRVRAIARDRLELLGVSVLYEPSGLLYADEDALAELIQRAVDLGLPLLFGRVEADSPLRPILSLQRARRALVFQRITHPSLAMVTRGSWETYTQGLSSRWMQNLNRWRKRAAEQFGTVTTEMLAPEVDEVDTLLDTAMRVEASGWKGRSGSAMLRKERIGRFFRLYARLAAARGELRVSILRFGPHVAAVELALEAHRRWWGLKLGYQETLAKYSPGFMLIHDILFHAFSRGLDAFEFLGSAEPWQERWHPVPRHYASILVYPMSWQGFWGFSVDAVDRAVKKLHGSLQSMARPGA